MIKFSIVIGIFIAIALLVPVQAQEDGLVAEWHFDEGAGNVVTDSSGNGKDGTIYGATWIDGKFGKALSFDGVNDYVVVNPSVNIGSGAKNTIEFWMYWNGGNNQMPLSWYGYDLWLYSGYFGFNTGESNVFGIPSLGLANRWIHVAAIFYNGVPDSINNALYINGNQQNLVSSVGKTSASRSVTTTTQISGASNGEYMFNGLIDEVRIYNRALSADEIKALYEQGTTGLLLTKAASPTSIKKGQTTAITLTITNTGSTEITDIEIADVIPKDLALIDGETKKTYTSLSPQDSRQFQYSVQINEAGNFNLGQATASYADNKGNYQTIKSQPASIEVIPSIVTDAKQTPSRKSNGNAQSASVNLHGEKTDVEIGENVLLKLSAVNIIGNPAMHVQVIIIPPSGWSVTSSEFAKSGAGQYTTKYDLESGDGKDIEVSIVPNQVGEDFKVEGRIVYYFGDDIATREDHTLDLPIKVRAKSNAEVTTVVPQNDNKSTPGFAFVVGLLGLLVAMKFIKRE